MVERNCLLWDNDEAHTKVISPKRQYLNNSKIALDEIMKSAMSSYLVLVMFPNTLLEGALIIETWHTKYESNLYGLSSSYLCVVNYLM